MLQHAVKALPVVAAARQVVGIVTDEDLLERAGVPARLSVARRLDAAEVQQALHELTVLPLTVADVMTHPVITVRDMVRAQALLLDHLEIEKLLTVLGGSMGGMQALDWATCHPDRIASAIVLATSGRPSPMAIAMNAVARWAIFNDPTWKKGEYRKNPKDGLALARGIGHITFLSDESMWNKFGRRFTARDGLFDFFGRFEVERYLSYNGYNFVDRFDANSFLYLAKALDLYDVAWGCESLQEAFAPVQAPMQFYAFTSDWLYPPAQTEEMVNALKELNKPVEYHLIESSYGHDAFLLEHETFAPYVKDFLERIAPGI